MIRQNSKMKDKNLLIGKRTYICRSMSFNWWLSSWKASFIHLCLCWHSQQFVDDWWQWNVLDLWVKFTTWYMCPLSHCEKLHFIAFYHNTWLKAYNKSKKTHIYFTCFKCLPIIQTEPIYLRLGEGLVTPLFRSKDEALYVLKSDRGENVFG